MKSKKNIRGIFLLLMMGVILAGCEKTGDRLSSEKNVKKEATELEEGDMAPDFTIELVGGEEITLSEQTDKVVLLNFWATWCGPCVGEMPAFERLAEEYKDEVIILAVNCMEDKKTVAEFTKENGYTFPIAYDVEGDICELYPSDGIPYTLMIDQKGVITKIYLGAENAEEQYQEYKEAIDDALGK